MYNLLAVSAAAPVAMESTVAAVAGLVAHQY
jgi:hypothetical protein